MSIVKGNLVMVVGARQCGCADSVGKIFTVATTEISRAYGRCITCGARTFLAGTSVAIDQAQLIYEFGRLKKIDPPSSGELTGVPLRLKEPA